MAFQGSAYMADWRDRLDISPKYAHMLCSSCVGLPQVIVFSFSKRECEELAQQMIDIDLNNSKEKKLVKGIFENAMDVLAQEDRNLAQISGVLPMLTRGIGIHHSGLLPIVKEVIEILFQEGLLKVLRI